MTVELQYDPAWRGDVRVPGPRNAQMPQSPVKGQWPPRIVLAPAVRDRLARWACEEIRQARLERQPLLDRWRKWQQDYWAEPEQKVKNFPFRGASNIVIPSTAIAVESVHARLMNTIWGEKPFFSLRALSGEWKDKASAIEEWLDNEVDRAEGIRLYDATDEALMELCKLGTMILKGGYVRDVRKSARTVAGTLEEYWYTCRNAACVDWVPRANFLMRLTDTDPQVAQWCGEEHEFSWGKLKSMAASGYYDPTAVERIRVRYTQGGRTKGTMPGTSADYQQTIDKLALTEPLWTAKYPTVEVWAAFDIDNDGYDEQIMFDIETESESLLHVRYNWNADLRRPYRFAKYTTVEGRFDGFGICKQNEQISHEITTIHRQRLDSATVANMKMFKAHRMSGIGPDTPIFPGKIFIMDDMTHFDSIDTNDVHNSAFANESSAVMWSEKRTGVNEIVQGLPETGTPDTATSNLTRLQQANTRPNLVLKNIRMCLGLIGRDTLMNYQRFGDNYYHTTTMGEDSQVIEEFLSLPEELAAVGVGVELTATDSLVNKQVQQQQMMGLNQVLQQSNMTMLQFAQMYSQISGDPKLLVAVLQRAMMVTDETRRQLLHTFGIQNIEELVFSPNSGGNNAQPANSLAGSNGGSGGGLQGIGQPTGMEGMAPMPGLNGGVGAVPVGNGAGGY